MVLQGVLLVVAILAWLAVVRLVFRGRAFSATTIVGLAVLIRIPFVLWDSYTNDLDRYLWEGRIQIAGENPFATPPDSPELDYLRTDDIDVGHPHLTTIYPPAAQGIFVCAVSLGLKHTGMRNLVVLLDVVVVLVLCAWLRATDRPPGWAILYALCPIAITASGTGHIDPLMLLFLAATGWAVETGRVLRAGAFLAVAVLAKTVAVLAVPWLLLRRPRAGLVLLPVLVLGYLPYVSGDLFGTLVRFGEEFAFNGSLFRGFEFLLSDPGHARLAIAAVFAVWVGLVTLTQPRFADACALLFAGLLFLSPTVHFWYLTWFLVMLPVVGRRAWAIPLIVWAATVVFSFQTYRAHYAGAPFREVFLLTWVEYLPPLLCAAWLGWRGWPRRQPPRVATVRGPAAGSTETGSTAKSGTETDGTRKGGAGAPAQVAEVFDVIVPCRGEFENLKALVPRWLDAGARRVILADTPTGDGTDTLAGSRVAYVPVEQRGYGAAAQAGLAASDAPFAVICDADHGRGPDQIGALMAPFFEGPAQTRELGASRIGLVTAARVGTAGLTVPQRFGNALATILIGLGWGRRFCDLGPFRALRRASWPDGALTDPGFGWNVEMNVRALELGLDVVEVALSGSEREHGKNRISSTVTGVIRTGYHILRQLYVLRERSNKSCARPSSS